MSQSLESIATVLKLFPTAMAVAPVSVKPPEPVIRPSAVIAPIPVITPVAVMSQSLESITTVELLFPMVVAPVEERVVKAPVEAVVLPTGVELREANWAAPGAVTDHWVSVMDVSPAMVIVSAVAPFWPIKIVSAEASLKFTLPLAVRAPVIVTPPPSATVKTAAPLSRTSKVFPVPKISMIKLASVAVSARLKLILRALVVPIVLPVS